MILECSCLGYSAHRYPKDTSTNWNVLQFNQHLNPDVKELQFDKRGLFPVHIEFQMVTDSPYRFHLAFEHLCITDIYSHLCLMMDAIQTMQDVIQHVRLLLSGLKVESFCWEVFVSSAWWYSKSCFLLGVLTYLNNKLQKLTKQLENRKNSRGQWKRKVWVRNRHCWYNNQERC